MCARERERETLLQARDIRKGLTISQFPPFSDDLTPFYGVCGGSNTPSGCGGPPPTHDKDEKEPRPKEVSVPRSDVRGRGGCKILPTPPPVVQTAKCKMVPKYHPGQCHSHPRRQRRPSPPQPSLPLRRPRRGDTTGLGTTPSTPPSPCRPSGRREQTCCHAVQRGFREPRVRSHHRLEMPSEVVEPLCLLPGRRARYPLSRGTLLRRHKGPESHNSRDLRFSRWRSCNNSNSSSSDSDRCSIRRRKRHRSPPRRQQSPR